jgi:hypothetical protein
VSAVACRNDAYARHVGDVTGVQQAFGGERRVGALRPERRLARVGGPHGRRGQRLRERLQVAAVLHDVEREPVGVERAVAEGDVERVVVDGLHQLGRALPHVVTELRH